MKKLVSNEAAYEVCYNYVTFNINNSSNLYNKLIFRILHSKIVILLMSIT